MEPKNSIGGCAVRTPQVTEQVQKLEKAIAYMAEVLSKLEVASLLGEDGVKYPHDAIFLPNHDIILATWNPGTLTYWQRVQDRQGSP